MHKQRLKLLVIEDDQQDFTLLQHQLKHSQRSSFVVSHAQNFEAAKRYLLDAPFDAILLDYYLGGHTGVDLLKYAKIVGLDVPIIVLTGSSDMGLDDSLMQLGAADFIPKDELGPSLLERTIRHAIERKQADLQMAEMLKRDPLTGLGNRTVFEEATKVAIARAQGNNSTFAIIFMDLDRFNKVNNTFGYYIGDILLTVIGHRLLKVVQEGDTVARIGGDEFMLLVENVASIHEVTQSVEQVLQEVMQPAQLDSNTLDVSASIGVTMYPEYGKTTDTLMKQADMALNECKQSTTSRYVFFSEALQQKLNKTFSLEKGIRLAIENNDFEMYYQPQINLQTGKLCGVEALIRWPQPDGSLCMPDEFISAANQMGLIVPLGAWVIDNVCQQLASWLQYGDCPVVSFNVSPRQLQAPSFKSHLLAAVERYNIPPDKLEIELTEDAFIEAEFVSNGLLEAIRNVGIRIAIDDFGTGYSSMQYLKTLPINRIKIDRAFVSGGTGKQVSDVTITQAIAFLARGLSLEVVAEGIETQEQWDELQSYGCMVGQGYFLNRPMPAPAFELCYFHAANSVTNRSSSKMTRQ